MQRLSKIDVGSGRVADFFIVKSAGVSLFCTGCTQCDRVQPLHSHVQACVNACVKFARRVCVPYTCLHAGVSCTRHERERGLYKPAYAREQQMYKASCARHAEYRERVCIVHDWCMYAVAHACTLRVCVLCAGLHAWTL